MIRLEGLTISRVTNWTPKIGNHSEICIR